MDRAIPEFNKLMVTRDRMINRYHHKTRLRTAEKAIDNNLPSGYRYPMNKRNKEA